MSDEEKKAIETIKDFKNLKWYEHAFDNGTEVLDEEQKQDIEIILNLIEKQSKEIEELKEENRKKSIVIIEYQDLYEKLEDKIKAKIEELEKQQKEEPDAYLCIKVLSSLLEKE